MEAKKNDKLREIFFIQTNTNKKPFLALTGKLQMEGQVWLKVAFSNMRRFFLLSGIFFLYKKHPVQQNSQFTSAYQVLLHMKASDASKELQRHFRQGLKFQNFGGMCVNISLMYNLKIYLFWI